MACPNVDELLVLLQSASSPEKQQQLDALLDSCAECRELVAMWIAAGLAQPTADYPDPHPLSADPSHTRRD